MKLDEKQIQKFQSIYNQKFGINLSCDEAREIGLKFLGIIELVYKPITVAEYEVHCPTLQQLAVG